MPVLNGPVPPRDVLVAAVKRTISSLSAEESVPYKIYSRDADFEP
jgi:hypothetical protein